MGVAEGNVVQIRDIVKNQKEAIKTLFDYAKNIRNTMERLEKEVARKHEYKLSEEVEEDVYTKEGGINRLTSYSLEEIN